MGKLVDLTGKRFGKLTVVERSENVFDSDISYVTWLCKCDCGNEKIVKANLLSRNKTRSCGCMYRTSNKYEFDENTGVCYLDDESIVYFDKDDYDRIKDYKWHLDSNGYASAVERMTKKAVRMHRLIMNYPAGMDIDHINHNKLDNRKSNLRVCTRSQNMMNLKMRSYNKTGFRGVCKVKKNKTNSFYSQITVDGKSVYLGYFKTAEEAFKARKEAEKKYYGEYAYKDD